MEPHGLMSGLPSDYLLVHFHRFHQVKTAAKQVFDALIENEDGNQFIVVLSFSNTARQRLDSEEDSLDGIQNSLGQARIVLIICISRRQHKTITRFT